MKWTDALYFIAALAAAGIGVFNAWRDLQKARKPEKRSYIKQPYNPQATRRLPIIEPLPDSRLSLGLLAATGLFLGALAVAGIQKWGGAFPARVFCLFSECELEGVDWAALSIIPLLAGVTILVFLRTISNYILARQLETRGIGVSMPVLTWEGPRWPINRKMYYIILDHPEMGAVKCRVSSLFYLFIKDSNLMRGIYHPDDPAILQIEWQWELQLPPFA